MNRALLCCVVLACGLRHALAQTNVPLAACELYCLPTVSLRALPAPPPVSQPKERAADSVIEAALAKSPAHRTDRDSGRTETMSLTSRERELDREFHFYLNQAGYLTRPEPKQENFLGRSLNAVFSPEVIHWRKVSVSCSLYTAIKRKNPLCLLNPIPLNVAW